MLIRSMTFSLFFVCISWLFSAQDSGAAIYQYTGKDGLVNITDDLQAIPPEYRASAEIVSGEAKEDASSSPAPRGQSAAGLSGTDGSAKGPEEKPASVTSPGGRVLISAVVVVSAVFVFFIIGAVDTENRKAKNVARIVLLWAVALYLLFAHAPDIAGLFSHAGKSVKEVQRRAEERGKKASRAVKALNALIGNGEETTNSPAAEEGR